MGGEVGTDLGRGQGRMTDQITFMRFFENKNIKGKRKIGRVRGQDNMMTGHQT